MLRCAALITLLLTLASTLTGCAGPGPRLAVDSARVSSPAASADATVLEVDLAAENPGPEPLPLRTVRYDVSVDGVTIFSGVRSAQATLARYGRSILRLPVPLPPGTPTPTQIEVSGTVEYISPTTFSRALADADLYQPAASFSASIPLSTTPAP